jgi:hypothetical protein
MKTTIEIQDELLERSKRLARQEGTSVSAHGQARHQPFAVQPFGGDGLAPEFQSAGWERLREEIYRGMG